MCIKTKDFFVLCPHKHWISVTINQKEIGKSILNSCNCNDRINKFFVIISKSTYERDSNSKVNYWNEKKE